MGKLTIKISSEKMEISNEKFKISNKKPNRITVVIIILCIDFT